MDKNVTVVNQKDTFTTPKTHKKMTMKLVEVKEPTKVKGLLFEGTHYFDIGSRNGHKIRYEYHMRPMYNLKNDFKTYRQKVGLLSPKKIKEARKHWGLSLRALSALTGISYSSISNIESGKKIQNIAQNNLLMLLTNPETMYMLITTNIKRITIYQPSHVSLKQLFKLAEKVNIEEIHQEES